MSLPASERLRWALLVGALALALVAFDAWWIATHRHGYPLDVDEAGYTAIGLVDYFGLREGGLDGWWDAVQTQAPHAPLVPAITSLLLIVKPGVLEGYGTLIGFLVLLVFATYGIGERLAGPRLGALAAFVVGASPGAFAFTREYVFALPTAALLSAAVYALLRSDGLRLRRWAIACGAALGLMLLARTMAVAFVPGVLVAGVLSAAVRAWLAQENTASIGGRALNLGLLVATGAAVASTWYLRNMQSVVDYLTDYGYGTQSNYYGAEQSLVSWSRLRAVAERMAGEDLLALFAGLVLLGLVALGVAVVQRVVAASDRRRELCSLAGSDAMTVAFVFIAGYAALTSSQNAGNGFTFPISVLLPPLAVIALCRYRTATAPVVVSIAAIGILNVAAATNLSEDLSRPRLVSVPGFATIPWIDSTPNAVGAIREQVPGSPIRFESQDRGWIEIDRQLARMSRTVIPPGRSPIVAFASRHRAISTNSVGLASLLEFRQGLPMMQLSAEPEDSVASYARQLSDQAFGPPGALVTTSTSVGDFPPLITQRYAETAARRLGFRQIRTIALPDGRELRVWVRS
jgi:Dolichyl-phosphate-mannose-protein mannosyltransferase